MQMVVIEVHASTESKLDMAYDVGIDEWLNVDLDTDASHRLNMVWTTEVNVDESGRLDMASDMGLDE